MKDMKPFIIEIVVGVMLIGISFLHRLTIIRL